MPGETATAICCMTMGGVLERFPRLKVCFAHGGGAFPYTLGRIEHGHAVRPDLCALENAISPRSVLDAKYNQEPMVAEGSWYNLYYMYTQKLHVHTCIDNMPIALYCMCIPCIMLSDSVLSCCLPSSLPSLQTIHVHVHACTYMYMYMYTTCTKSHVHVHVYIQYV